jgi:hypothetical protein
MEEYPRNLSDFEARFATEQACRDSLFLHSLARGLSLPELRL